jgi:hypothetical protein
MHVLRGTKRFLQFATDPDTYCLLWLAVRNRFRKQATTPSAAPRKRRAKAVNAG